MSQEHDAPLWWHLLGCFALGTFSLGLCVLLYWLFTDLTKFILAVAIFGLAGWAWDAMGFLRLGKGR